MRKWCSGFAALAVLASGAKAEEVVLEPSSQWVLDYHEDKCRLARTFGEGEAETVLFLEQLTPGDTFSWLVSGPALKTLRLRREVSVRFGPRFEPFNVSQGSSMRMDEYGNVLEGVGYQNIENPFGQTLVESSDGMTTVAPPTSPVPQSRALQPHDGAQIDHLQLRQPGRFSLRLNTGRLDKAFDAMNACMDNLVATWGVDPATLRKQMTQPRWLNQAALARRIMLAYPRKALNAGEQANFQMRVIVNPDGSVANCKLINLTLADSFDDRVCPIVRESGQFEAARDASGAPLTSFVVSNIVYRIN
ncbi:energy transducer TonB [Porphyrobacter sp. GA68]|uniref:energy transducer TonB n=1 Tax=Porphyrobacter sp. GA68 TaxID=2883480 RepID=UPI001D18D7E3|nr:energy transducer TonB [Porphyrobacter sp. GA68]